MRRLTIALLTTILVTGVFWLPAIAQEEPFIPEYEGVEDIEDIKAIEDMGFEDFDIIPEEVPYSDEMFFDELAPADIEPMEAEAETPISLELRGVSAYDAVSLIFRTTDYSFTIDPGVKGQVTVSLNNVPFGIALRAILDQIGATYRKEGNLYSIVPVTQIGTEGAVGIGLPRVEAPKRLKALEMRYVDASEMAFLFGGSVSGASGGFGAFTAGYGFQSRGGFGFGATGSTGARGGGRSGTASTGGSRGGSRGGPPSGFGR